MVNRLAVVVMAGLSCLSAQAAFPLAKDGQPAARIVIAADAHPAVAYAAEELQRWVEAISGARLPIDAGAGGAGPKVVLAVNPAGFEDDLAKMAGAHVIATAHGAEAQEQMRRLGAACAAGRGAGRSGMANRATSSRSVQPTRPQKAWPPVWARETKQRHRSKPARRRDSRPRRTSRSPSPRPRQAGATVR